MLKIEKIKNGYILEIEKIISLNQSMDSQIEDAMSAMKTILPQITAETMNQIDGDQVLNSIRNAQNKIESDGIIKPLINKNKIYFTNIKNLIAFLSFLTENLDETNLLTNPDNYEK